MSRCIFSMRLFVCAAAWAWSAAWTLASPAETLEEKARRIHAEAYVIDTHSDTTPKFEDPRWDFSQRHRDGHMDIPRLREGGFDGQFFSIYMPRTPGDGRAIKRALRRIDSVYKMAERYPEDFVVATTAEEIRKASAQGKMAALMGIEGGHIIEGELSALRMYYRLGARYMTLTHSFNTRWADSAGTGEPIRPDHNGLTEFGRRVVSEMNRLGMMVDISHVSDATFWDALEVSKAPLLASHSSVRALVDHPRNMSDKMIKAMAAKGGVIQINFYPGYVDPELAAWSRNAERRIVSERRWARREAIMAKSPASRVVDHIEHVIELAGADHVGMGSDWDGVPNMPRGLDECSDVIYITEELLRRGHGEEAIKKVLGGNMLRLMEDVEAVAASWK